MSDSLQLLWLCATVFHVGCLCSVLQLWECGIEQCKEIASQLETVTYNFEKLSEIHVRACISFSGVFLFKCNSVHVMNCNIWFKYCISQKTIARFYHNIIHELRAEPEYFRVGFFGGFPPFLKVQHKLSMCTTSCLNMHVRVYVYV